MFWDDEGVTTRQITLYLDDVRPVQALVGVRSAALYVFIVFRFIVADPNLIGVEGEDGAIRFSNRALSLHDYDVVLLVSLLKVNHDRRAVRSDL